MKQNTIRQKSCDFCGEIGDVENANPNSDFLICKECREDQVEVPEGDECNVVTSSILLPTDQEFIFDIVVQSKRLNTKNKNEQFHYSSKYGQVKIKTNSFFKAKKYADSIASEITEYEQDKRFKKSEYSEYRAIAELGTFAYESIQTYKAGE